MSRAFGITVRVDCEGFRYPLRVFAPYHAAGVSQHALIVSAHLSTGRWFCQMQWATRCATSPWSSATNPKPEPRAPSAASLGYVPEATLVGFANPPVEERVERAIVIRRTET